MKRYGPHLKICVLFFLVVLVSGCASARQYVPFPDQSKRVEDPQKGRIYVMRPSSFGAAISMGVNDKEKKIGKTGPKTFLCWERSPGRTTIYSTSENTTELPIDVDPGQVYYVLQRPHIGLLTARNTIELISDKTGKYYLDQCKPPKMVGEK